MYFLDTVGSNHSHLYVRVKFMGLLQGYTSPYRISRPSRTFARDRGLHHAFPIQTVLVLTWNHYLEDPMAGFRRFIQMHYCT
jgi:hypothetical protein